MEYFAEKIIDQTKQRQEQSNSQHNYEGSNTY